MKDKLIKVIGAGVGGVDVSSEHIKWADLLVGGERLLKEINSSKEKLLIKGSIKDVLRRIAVAIKEGKKVLVVSDGDPLFFGIGKRMIQEFGKECVEIHPNVTVSQVACARLGIPFDEIKVVSIHGKKEFFSVLSALMQSDIVGIYTDGAEGPKRIAKELLKREIRDFFMIVLEELETDKERIREFKKIEHVLEEDFFDLNFAVLRRISGSKHTLKIGMDDSFYRHERGLITKKEIRVISISKLELKSDSTVWDIGAGCGSVGIECSCISKEGRIFCIEKELKRFYMIKENIKRAGAYIVEAICGKAPDCLKELPSADRVFVGGGLSEDPLMLEHISRYMKQDGIIVINIALIENLANVLAFIKEKGWEFELTQVMISRSHPIGKSTALTPLNPIFIIKVERRSKNVVKDRKEK